MQDIFDWCAGTPEEIQEILDELPPDAPLSDDTQGALIQMTNGCWQLTVAPGPEGGPPRAGRPRAVLVGEQGTWSTAPPLSSGIVGTFAPMTTHHWLFMVTQAPDPADYEEGTMLLGEGDKLLFEYTPDNGWMIRVEHLQPSPHPIVAKARQRRADFLNSQGGGQTALTHGSADHRGIAAQESASSSSSRGPNHADTQAAGPSTAASVDEQHPPPGLEKPTSSASTSQTANSRGTTYSYYPRPHAIQQTLDARAEAEAEATATAAQQPPRPTTRQPTVPQTAETSTADDTPAQQAPPTAKKEPFSDGRTLRRSQQQRNQQQQQAQHAPSAGAPSSSQDQQPQPQSGGQPQTPSQPTSSNGASEQPARSPHPLSDGRTLRSSQANRLPRENQPSQQPSRSTPLAERVADGRQIPPRQDPIRQPTTTTTTSQQTTTTWTPDARPTPADETSPDDEANSFMHLSNNKIHSTRPEPSTNPSRPPPQPTAATILDTPTGSQATTLPLPGQSTNPSHPTPHHPSSSSGDGMTTRAGTGGPIRLGSWEHVERSLEEIRRLARSVQGSMSEGILWNADPA